MPINNQNFNPDYNQGNHNGGDVSGSSINLGLPQTNDFGFNLGFPDVSLGSFLGGDTSQYPSPSGEPQRPQRPPTQRPQIQHQPRPTQRPQQPQQVQPQRPRPPNLPSSIDNKDRYVLGKHLFCNALYACICNRNVCYCYMIQLIPSTIWI